MTVLLCSPRLAINKIPSFSISGSGSGNLTESTREVFEDVSLSMYGDYELSDTGLTPPSDFDTACSFYAKSVFGLFIN